MFSCRGGARGCQGRLAAPLPFFVLLVSSEIGHVRLYTLVIIIPLRHYDNFATTFFSPQWKSRKADTLRAGAASRHFATTNETPSHRPCVISCTNDFRGCGTSKKKKKKKKKSIPAGMGVMRQWAFFFPSLLARYFIYRQLKAIRALSTFNRCSLENQKGAIAVQCLYGDSTLLVLTERLWMSNNALLALAWRYGFTQQILH